jgi:antitoxin component of RelBE/YafQ-DinJ toxin-antitoxin module
MTAFSPHCRKKNVDNQQKPDKSSLSDLERWRNLCDAMSEDALREQQSSAPRVKVKHPAGIKPPLSRTAHIRIQLARLARDGQLPADRTAQIRAEQYQLEQAYEQKRKNPAGGMTDRKAVEEYRRFVASLNESEKKEETTPAAEPASPPKKKSKPRRVS